MAEESLIDWFLEQPYWVIDVLPSQVPESAGNRFFAVERVLLEGAHHDELRRRFAQVLLKLNCYHDFVVYRGESEKGKLNPNPAKLEKWVLRNNEGLSIVISCEDAAGDAKSALIAVPTDSTCMALYNPTSELIEQAASIAAASGLFVWKPPQG